MMLKNILCLMVLAGLVSPASAATSDLSSILSGWSYKYGLPYFLHLLKPNKPAPKPQNQVKAANPRIAPKPSKPVPKPPTIVKPGKPVPGQNTANNSTKPASTNQNGAPVSTNPAPPQVPAPYASGPLKAPDYVAPNLFKSEKAAFAALEGAMQEAEAVVYASGCAAAAGPARSRTWDISVFVDDTGTGYVEVSTNGAHQFILDVVEEEPTFQPPAGTAFRVTGLESNVLGGKNLPVYTGVSHYSATGQMMVLSATFQVQNVNNFLDNLSGEAIKDFYKVNPARASAYPSSIPVIYDWGLQSISKNDVPQDKWWQRSAANRSDNFFGKTRFRKDRLFSAKSGGVCSIDISMEGTNDADLFDQTGTLTIKKAAPSPF